MQTAMSLTAGISDRAKRLLAEHEKVIHVRTDRMFCRLLLAEWVLAMVAALVVSPAAWAGTTYTLHIHVWAAVILGGAIVSLPCVLVAHRPGAAVTRHVVAIAQMLMGGLYIHLSGGRIETHFHVFGSLAFLCFYRDWRVLVTGTLVVVADHLTRGLLWPQSVYGVLTIEPWRFLEHAGWVAFEDIFLVASCLQGVREMTSIACHRAELERTNHVIAQRIAERTAALQASEARFKALAVSSPVGILQANESGQCTYTNPQWRALTGQDKISSQGPGWLAAVHVDDRNEVSARWNAAFSTHTPFSQEFRLAGNEPRWVQVQGGVIAGQAANGQVCSIVDVTEQKKAVAEQVRAREAAESANQTKSEFLANVSHELRTPLNAIIGFSEILSGKMFGELNAKQTRHVSNILTSGRHLLSLINDVLDLSKVEAGNLELHLETFDVQQALEDVDGIVTGLASKKEIHVSMEIPADLPALYADPRQFKQIMYNLLSNAIKFTPQQGRVEVHVKLADGMQISVSDNGIGILPEDQDRIFKVFEQVNGSYSRDQQGTGLGLSLTRRLVELHGGRIWVESNLTAGTTFTFTLPAKSASGPPSSIPGQNGYSERGVLNEPMGRGHLCDCLPAYQPVVADPQNAVNIIRSVRTEAIALGL